MLSVQTNVEEKCFFTSARKSQRFAIVAGFIGSCAKIGNSFRPGGRLSSGVNCHTYKNSALIAVIICTSWEFPPHPPRDCVYCSALWRTKWRPPPGPGLGCPHLAGGSGGQHQAPAFPFWILLDKKHYYKGVTVGAEPADINKSHLWGVCPSFLPVIFTRWLFIYL